MIIRVRRTVVYAAIITALVWTAAAALVGDWITAALSALFIVLVLAA